MGTEDDKERWAMTTFRRAFKRSRAELLEFDLELHDIATPDRCPETGIELDYASAGVPGAGMSRNRPALLRRDTSVGWTRANCYVASTLAGMRKSRVRAY